MASTAVKALVEHTAALGEPLWHSPNLYKRFIDTLEKSNEPPAGLPARVFICGISALPPSFSCRALRALGKRVDIYRAVHQPVPLLSGAILKPHFWPLDGAPASSLSRAA
ncbi:exodeoxyribonuclease V subunit gamma [Shigella flexneri]